jgi:hypothetical protein
MFGIDKAIGQYPGHCKRKYREEIQYLTDVHGGFILSMPAGDYIVTVKEQVFDQDYTAVW